MVDGTLFQIVENLTEIQHVTEKQAYHMRQQLMANQNAERQALLKRQKSELQTAQDRPQALLQLETAHLREVQLLTEKHQGDLTRCDMKIVTQLDQKVSEQQVILEKAGVPGFHVTNDPQEIRLQQYLLRFINEVSLLNLPPLSPDPGQPAS